ncbi:MAG: efflux RND transporter periplasmic adaptor subunit [Desulfovibrionaceae bacterium]|jgi:RND family efflux transporter MFP subunit|nr:efflux RND transporter periplasmic adaptor subunit [Desulfovibrionaceae bacterium]
MRMPRLSRLALLLAFLGLAAAAIWLLRAHGSDAAEPRVLQTARVERATVREELSATGTIKPEVGAIVKVGCQATGRIKRMRVRVGQAVREGDLIAEIDDRELAAERAEAEAELRHARAELGRVESVYPLEIDEAAAELTAARATARYAALNLDRVRQLEAQRLTSRDALDSALADADVAANDERVRAARLTRLRAEQARALEKAREDVATAASALQTAAVRQTYTQITSPIDGVVSRVAAQEGETVVAGLQVANLITIVDPARLELQIFVDENDVTRVHPGSPVDFAVDGYPDRTFSGAVERIAPEPELRDDLVYYLATVRLDRATAELLRPEMSARCRITARVRENALSVPNAALKWVGGKQVVFVVGKTGGKGTDGGGTNGAVLAATPKLGVMGRERCEVLEGLAEDDVVAVKLVLADGK